MFVRRFQWFQKVPNTRKFPRKFPISEKISIFFRNGLGNRSNLRQNRRKLSTKGAQIQCWTVLAYFRPFLDRFGPLLVKYAYDILVPVNSSDYAYLVPVYVKHWILMDFYSKSLMIPCIFSDFHWIFQHRLHYYAW